MNRLFYGLDRELRRFLVSPRMRLRFDPLKQYLLHTQAASTLKTSTVCPQNEFMYRVVLTVKVNSNDIPEYNYN
jgi:hypothetical protein